MSPFEPTGRDAAPDAAGAVVGWRAWSIARSPDGRSMLQPLYQGTEPWPAMSPARASCRRGEHRAPDPRCGCGLYSVSNPGLLSIRDAAVVGTVSLWGRVVEHDRGHRAEFAYPLSIRLVCARCGRSRALDSMVVREQPGRAAKLIAVCARHRRTRGLPSRPAGEVQEELLSIYGVEALPAGSVAGRGRRSTRVAWHGLSRIAKTAVVAALVEVAAVLPLAAGGLAGTFAGAAPLGPARVVPAAAIVEAGPAVVSVCGEVRGRRVGFVSCGEASSDLAGLAFRDPGSVGTCLPGYLFTRGPGYSVCWAVTSGEPVPPERALRLARLRWHDLEHL